MPILLFYRLIFMVELFIAELLYIFPLQKRGRFPLRFPVSMAAGFALAFILPLAYGPLHTALAFLILFAVTLPLLKFCCDESWVSIFFCGIAAYTTQHIAYGTANFLMTLIQYGQSPIFGMYYDGQLDWSAFDLNTLLMVLVYLFAYFVSYLLLYLAFARKIRRGERLRIRSRSAAALVGVAFFIDIFINAMVVYLRDDASAFVSLLNIFYENLCCIFLLNVQFALLKTGSLENELDLSRHLLHEKERQYNLSKESIALVNLKCHDLRHQIRQIGKSKALSAEAVREIEDAVSIYDAGVRTGNEVLDIILTEKSLKCSHDGIVLTCVVDGKALEFMDQADTYSLFGNALDNAIEAVMALPPERRSIGVTVRQVGDMVSVNVHNPYAGCLTFASDGLPVTAKDASFHGFGLRSIQYTAEKYSGSVAISTAGGVFSLNVLLARKM